MSPNLGSAVRPFAGLCALNSLGLFPSWRSDVRRVGTCVLSILYMGPPAWVAMSALFHISALSILCMCVPRVEAMFARAAPKFKKINGFNKYQPIVCLQLFGVYVGTILFIIVMTIIIIILFSSVLFPISISIYL